MSKCIGCGVKLQSKDKNELGFTLDLNNNLCERCFRIRNYNEYKTVVKDNSDYIEILKNIDKTNDLVVLVVDLFNINYSLKDISKYLNNKTLLVLTKRDILPKSCYDEKLKVYFENYKLNIIDTVVISSIKNYNFDELFDKINKYKTSNNVYVVGYTNSGKSTMINKILYNYSNLDTKITTSYLPSTTIDSIELVVNSDLTLIDTPGLLDDGDIVNFIDSKTLKRIIPKKEIKPITYQIKKEQSILIDNLVKIDIKDDTSMTIYMSNLLDIKREFKDTNKSNLKQIISVPSNSDVVIQGLGFIKFTESCEISVYCLEGVRVFVRKNLI